MGAPVALNSVATAKFFIPGLHNSILTADGGLLAIKPFEFNYLSNSGMAVLSLHHLHASDWPEVLVIS